MTSVDYRCLTISAGDGRREMNERGKYHRVYSIRVQSDATNLHRVFTFHDSEHNEERGKVGLSADELLEAFYCVVQDALAGEMTFREFVDQYGYEDAADAHDIWTACQRSARKVRELFHNDPDLYAMADELQQMEEAR